MEQYRVPQAFARRVRILPLMWLPVTAVFVTLGSVLHCSVVRADVGFWSIGALSDSGFSSHANAVSSDGTTVVGQSVRNGITEAILWTKEKGITSLGILDGKSITRGTSVSHDGQVVVGAGYSSSGSESTIFRWTPLTGLTVLPQCGCENVSNLGAAVSDDGRTIVSRRDAISFVWTAETGSLDIGDFPGGNTFSIPIDLTPDGSIVVGEGSTSDGIRGFKWSEESGFEELGELMSSAYAVSADGSAIAGVGFQDGQGAVKWTEEEGPEWLGHLPNLIGRPASFASDISADGSVIVGGSGGDFRFGAFRWTRESGMQSVESLLGAHGVDITGWQLGSANAVSADGRVIVGTGINPDGNREGWIAAIPPTFVPEPSSFLCLMIGGFLYASSHRLRTRTAQGSDASA